MNYDPQNWKLLTMSVLQFPHIVRAQLIDDAMYLARANILDYEIPFALIIESFRETKYVSMLTALNNLKYIDNMLAHTPVYGKFKVLLTILPFKPWQTDANENMIFSYSCHN